VKFIRKLLSVAITLGLLLSLTGSISVVSAYDGPGKETGSIRLLVKFNPPYQNGGALLGKIFWGSIFAIQKKGR